MRVLLDENLPQKLRNHLPGHDVVTVGYMGWSGIKNGDLILAAETSRIQVLVTGDKSLVYQQNSAKRRIAIVALSAVSWQILKGSLSEIAAEVDRAVPGSFQFVECGSRPPT